MSLRTRRGRGQQDTLRKSGKSQEVPPEFDWYCPYVQELHPADPVLLLYVPDGQRAQVPGDVVEQPTR